MRCSGAESDGVLYTEQGYFAKIQVWHDEPANESTTTAKPFQDASSPPFLLSAQARRQLVFEPNVTRYVYLFLLKLDLLPGCIYLTFETRIPFKTLCFRGYKLWKAQARCEALSYSPLAVDPSALATIGLTSRV